MTNQSVDQALFQETFVLPKFFENNQFFNYSAIIGGFFTILGVIVMYLTPPFVGFNVSGHPIFYMVSEAFMAFVLFTIAFVSSILFIWKRKIVYDTITVAAVKTGILASLLTLLIGMFWANAEWGAFWQWDPR